MPSFAKHLPLALKIANGKGELDTYRVYQDDDYSVHVGWIIVGLCLLMLLALVLMLL